MAVKNKSALFILSIFYLTSHRNLTFHIMNSMFFSKTHWEQ